MWKKIKNAVLSRDYELEERMLRTIILVAGIATIIAIGECFFVMDIANILILIFIFLLLVMTVIFVVTFKYKKYNIAAMMLGFVIIVIVFPPMFLLSGAVHSGASVWLALGILYVFIMFKGVKLVVFLSLTIITYGITYYVAYKYPDYVVPMISKAAYYGDAFYSVIMVGCISGAILKTHMKMFEQEHKINILQKEELQKSRDSKNVLFANVNHELRTPINAIIGLNEMILRSNPTEEIQEYSKDIQMASKLLLNQVNDILDLSQMEMGRMKIIPVEYRTQELFGELVELVRFQMEKKGLEFYVDIDKSLPAVLQGDEKRIKQIILNILDNARKYTHKGSVILTVQSENDEDGYILLKIKVADTGVGIRKEDLEYIYESFNRFDEKENQRIMGSGLGLAITKQLVDLMDGEITVDSIYTKGTVFTISLKQKVIENTSINTIEYLKGRIDADGVYQIGFEAPEARILVVDDNKMNSKVATSLLSSTKMQIDVANSGQECLEMTKKKYYHVILLDYMMPGMNGVETLAGVRKQENGLCKESAIIALTGNTISGAREMYQKQGFDGYVEKPIQSRLLEVEVLKFLSPEIIEYLNDEVIEEENISQIQKTTMKKRKKVYITTDCVCDIPSDLLEKYDIKLMYLYIKTPNGRFADTREIDSDSLKLYMTSDSTTAYGDAVTVEEYEEFFAEALTESERLIHISLASRAGRAHGIAVTAAKGFDHVTVVDSGLISCGQGMLVLHAAKMAMEGKSHDEIYKSVEEVKKRIDMRFMMPGAEIFYQNGRTTASVAKLCRALQLHPYITMKQSKPMFLGFLGGSLENAWKHGIYWHFRKKKKICLDVVYITHAGCSVKQLEYIKNEVLRLVSFEKVIIQKASFSSACTGGLESVAIAFYTL